LNNIILKLFFLALIICSIFLCGCCISEESAPPHITYTIKISGLSNYMNNNTTDILIPVPLADNDPLINEKDALSQTTNWSISIADTDYGKMLCLENKQKNLSNVSIEYSKTILDAVSNSTEFDILNKSLTEIPLHPITSSYSKYSILQELPDVTYFANDYHRVKNYSSYIGIDKYIQPIVKNNNTIEVMLSFEFARGMIRGKNMGGVEWAGTYTIIPDGVTGFIPVNISVWDSDFS